MSSPICGRIMSSWLIFDPTVHYRLSLVAETASVGRWNGEGVEFAGDGERWFGGLCKFEPSRGIRGLGITNLQLYFL